MTLFLLTNKDNKEMRGKKIVLPMVKYYRREQANRKYSKCNCWRVEQRKRVRNCCREFIENWFLP